MIKSYVGGIGSGKSISLIKEIVDRDRKSYTNFKLYNLKNYERLKVQNLVKQVKEKETGKIRYMVNYDYWDKQLKKDTGFDIYIDEIHNIANSRTGQKKLNLGLNMWVAQVRKVLQGNESNNLNYCTQRPMAVDIGWRDLTHAWIVCEKKELPIQIETELYNKKKVKINTVIVFRKYFDSLKRCLEYMQFGVDRSFKKDKFIANMYYKYYNTTELITFSDKYI